MQQFIKPFDTPYDEPTEPRLMTIAPVAMAQPSIAPRKRYTSRIAFSLPFAALLFIIAVFTFTALVVFSQGETLAPTTHQIQLNGRDTGVVRAIVAVHIDGKTMYYVYLANNPNGRYAVPSSLIGNLHRGEKVTLVWHREQGTTSMVTQVLR